MEINFCEFGESLGTRNLGNIIRKKIERNIIEGNKIIFDLKDVEIISNSFADECFGKLVLNFAFVEIKEKTNFINVNSINKKIISKAFNTRLLNKSKDVACAMERYNASLKI